MTDRQASQTTELGNIPERIKEHLVKLVTYFKREQRLVDVHVLENGEKIMEKSVLEKDNEGVKSDKQDHPNVYTILVSKDQYSISPDNQVNTEIEKITTKLKDQFERKIKDTFKGKEIPIIAKDDKVDEGYKVGYALLTDDSTIVIREGNKIKFALPPDVASIKMLGEMRLENYKDRTGRDLY